MDGYDLDDPRKGRFKPAYVAVGALLAALGAGALYMGLKGESEKLTAEQIASQRKGIYLLPRAEQLPAWHKELDSSSIELQQEALLQMSLLHDPELVALAGKSLSTSTDHRVRAVAAQVIADAGMPAAGAARSDLLKAFNEADQVDKPQIAWALVVVGEKSVFKDVLEMYKIGHLATIERPGGGRAFDLDAFSQMATPDDWAQLAHDPNDAVRQLVAGILSRTGDKKYTSTLVSLVNDPKNAVAREAASGLGKIGDSGSLKPLLDALARADKDDRQRFLEALRDGIGGEGLVLALDSVSRATPERTKFQTKQIFDMLRMLADPRAGNALVKYIATNPPVHWRTEAALRLAEVGDVRAAGTLGDRLKLDPRKLYDDKIDPELRRDDNERVVGARMLADLAILHPEAHADLRAKAEDGALAWCHEYPQPHANGLRFLAASESQKALAPMREWANPTTPLPKEGASGAFPEQFATASSALRYLGWEKDASSWGLLEKQLTRKDPKYDITENGLMGAGLSMVAMVLRGLSVGASQGYAQWGDARANPILVKFIEDAKQNEGARVESCHALPWASSEDDRRDALKKARAAGAADPKTQFVRACYLESVLRRPVEGGVPTLLEMLDKNVDPNVRHQVARAIGFSGVDAATEKTLLDKVGDKDLMNDAALALLLGGSEDGAARAVARYNGTPKEVGDELKDLYYDSFGYWSDEDMAKGRLYRFVANAEAIAHVRVGDALQEWGRLRLGGQFANLEFDSGPHSMTRVVLRYRLMQAAKTGDLNAKHGAIETLKFMHEQGSLMALRDEKGDTGPMAKRALFELLNPKTVSGETVPEKKTNIETPSTRPAGGR